MVSFIQAAGEIGSFFSESSFCKTSQTKIYSKSKNVLRGGTNMILYQK
jgi:hypothetical protein